MGNPRLAEKIFREIPSDRWVYASEIAEKLGLSAKKVGAIIGYKMLYHYPIERKKDGNHWGNKYLYRRGEV